MGKASRVAETDYKKALMGTSYASMFTGKYSGRTVFAQYFGTQDYYYDLAQNADLLVILDKVRVVDTLAINMGNPYVKLPNLFNEGFIVCHNMDEFKDALSYQKRGIIAYGTDEADEDKDDDDETKETFAKKLDKLLQEVGVKVSNIIQNPPYSGTLHLDFFNLGLNCLEPDGMMTIIEPSTWLINIRKYDENRKSGKNIRKSDYDLIQGIKAKIKGHVRKVVIENLNKDFSIADYHPLSITYVDFSQNYDSIEFECCGEKKIVNSIYDCNLIGSYDTIWSILNKVLGYGDMMDKHIFDGESEVDSNTKYLRYWNYQMYGLGSNYGGVVKQYMDDSDALQRNVSNGRYMMSYVVSAADGDICNSVVHGKKGNECDCIYGTQQELENWKHFVFNNKLPLFINIVLTIDQNNNSKEFLPWLVDRKYTDEEIYAKFNLTKDEIALIDATLKKFERNSPWFKQYMCGNSDSK